MKEIKIGENLIWLRHEKRITQEQLADFIGVTKASVSKWENGLSYPDIETLPRLATFFDVSLDDLMGYEPDLDEEQIMEIYGALKEEFARQSFEDGMEHSRKLAKQYYHCYPLLFQICVLWLNHYYMAPREQQAQIIMEARDLAGRIRRESSDVDIQNGAVIMRATAQLLLKDADAVIEELERVQEHAGSLQEVSSLLIRAYEMKQETDKARGKAQRCIYAALVRLVSDSVLYLDLTTDREDVFEETVRRVLELMKVYAFETLHPNNAALFFYHAAVGYAGFGKERQAAAMLQRYWDAVRQLMLVDHAQLHGDDYFTEINSWFDGASKAAPRESNLVRESIVQSMDHPVFQCLDKNKDFLRIRHEMVRYAQDAQKHTEE